MVLDRHRDRLDWWLVPLAKALRGIHPNVFTWWSLVVAGAAGVAFAFSGPERLWPLALGTVLLIINGTLDVLDGKVAKITGKQTAKGDYLDHAIDRFSDVAFLGGLAVSPWVRLEVGLAAVTATLLVSYLGTQAQAVGLGRNYGGMLGRADRSVLLMIVPWVQIGLVRADVMLPPWWIEWSPTLLDTLLLYFAAAGAIAGIQRFVSGVRGFDADGNVRP